MGQYRDLTMPIVDGMPVFDGDPPVRVEQFQTVENDAWNLSILSLTTHVGTHINVPYHIDDAGKKLDSYSLADFTGPVRCYDGDITEIVAGKGIAFCDRDALTCEVYERIVDIHPSFVLFPDMFAADWELEVERGLLAAGIISYENVINLDTLEKKKDYLFYGIPLRIADGDGSPARCFVEV